jgi:hypothetical protein
MGEEYGAMPTMLCCVCGMEITPNPANMCVACLRNEVDITSIIPTQLTMHSCRGCQRFVGIHYFFHIPDLLLSPQILAASLDES